MTHLEFTVRGSRALFTTLDSHLGGEKHTFPYPTYEALKGVVKSIYWKPTIIWHIEKVRVMRRVRVQSEKVKTRAMDAKAKTKPSGLHIYSYLQDVEYQVVASFKFNQIRENLKGDHNFAKHLAIAKRALERGGRRDVFLGTRECQAYVEPTPFGSGEGEFDNTGEFTLPRQYHSLLYPDEIGGRVWKKALFDPKMVNGVIEFPEQLDCPVIIDLFERPMQRLGYNAEEIYA